MFKQIAIWLAMLIPSILVEVFCYILNPLIAVFTRTEVRTDRVKRMGNVQVTMPRTYLQKWCSWFQTHDNAVDEYWWGMFTVDSTFKYVREATQEQYNHSAFLRYLCRLLWMNRNCAYGFLYNWFGRELQPTQTLTEHGTKDSGLWYKHRGRGNSWQLQAYVPLLFGVYLDINIGWKEHDGFPRAMYANRLIAFRKR
jgi:hypothetical protein